MEITCPICHRKNPWEKNLYRPFCSERCKLIDLGHWSEGTYTLPVEEEDEGVNNPEES